MNITSTGFMTKVRRQIALVLILLLLLILIPLYLYHAKSDFQQSFETYEGLAKTHVALGYIPGASDNPVREKLNTILSQVLARPLTPKERLALAGEGLSALKEGERQIDAIGDAGEKVQIAITYMESKSTSVGMFFSVADAKRILALAKEEFGVVSDIRGLSYRANFHTAEIFNRIVLDKGELTPAYTTELNAQIPAVEEQFNKRASLYESLKSLSARIEKEAASM